MVKFIALTPPLEGPQASTEENCASKHAGWEYLAEIRSLAVHPPPARGDEITMLAGNMYLALGDIAKPTAHHLTEPTAGGGEVGDTQRTFNVMLLLATLHVMHSWLPS
jgi:hypothetical protein